MADEISLSAQVIPAQKMAILKFGSRAYDLDAKSRFAIKVGENWVIDVRVPDDKQWRVSVDLKIIEESI